MKNLHFPLIRDILWGALEFGNNSYKAWYNTKGFHTQPAFYNAMSNVLLRLLMAKTNDSTAQDYGEHLTLIKMLKAKLK